MHIRKGAAALAVAVISVVGIAGSAAYADPPGPGDGQCVPGQHGNPHPGFKAGACK